MKILIAGSRKFKVLRKVEDWLDHNCNDNDIIISGGATGPDKVAEEYAREYDIPFEIFYPDWDKYGKKAGPLRNEEMVKIANKVVVFWDGESKGSKSTIDFALKYKKSLEVIFE